MTTYAFVNGIMAILTVPGFLTALVVALVLSGFFVRTERAMLHVLIFGLLVLLLYAGLAGVIFMSPGSLSNQYNFPPHLNILFSLCSFVAALWLFLSYSAWFQSKTVMLIFEGLAILSLALLFSASNFASTGPMLFPFAYSESRQLPFLKIVLPLLAFAVGLVLPMALLTGLFGGIVARLREKVWLRYFYWLLAGFLLFTAVNNVVRG